MGMFDILANIAQTYRQHTLFSLEKDDPTVTVSYVEIFYSALPEYKRKEIQLTPKPVPDDKFSTEYAKMQTKWIIENLKIVERGFAEYLYYRRQMLVVLQLAVNVYRQVILYNLQNNRDINIAVGLIEIMNLLLPKAAKATLMERPNGDDLLASVYEKQLRYWTMESLKQIEQALGKYVYQIMAIGQH